MSNLRGGSIVLVALAAMACSACSLFRRTPTSQQQFVDALSRGDGAQMNQIWASMSPEDRNKLRFGQGLDHKIDPNQVEQQLRAHEASLDPQGDSADSDLGGRQFAPAVLEGLAASTGTDQNNHPGLPSSSPDPY